MAAGWSVVPHQGMLFVASDVDPQDEADFNRWYDQEHVEERARIEGFLSAARYQAVAGGPKYLGLYRTASLDAFTSASYAQAFKHQTPWSVSNLGRMRRPTRRVCAVQATVGQGSGAWLGVLTLPPADKPASLVDAVTSLNMTLALEPGFVHAYLLLPDQALSTPLPNEASEGRRLDPLLVIESSDAQASEAALTRAAEALHADAARAARYQLKWKLHQQELRK